MYIMDELHTFMLFKFHVQLFCIVIAAFTADIRFGNTDVDHVAEKICYGNPRAKISGGRICLSLVATAITSIIICVVLMIFDVLIPCVDKMVRLLM